LELAGDLNLAPDTVRYSYMPVLIQKKTIHIDIKNCLHVTKGKMEKDPRE